VAGAKKPIDNSAHYKHSGHKLKDRIYNSIIDRYGKKGNPWKTSDAIVWGGTVYELPTIFGYIIQVAFFWWLATLAIKRYDGDTNYGIMMLLILALWRIGMLLKQVTVAREELEYLNGKRK
jgi:hypothetical protein